MSRKLSAKTLAEHEAKQDVWQEVLDSVDEVKRVGVGGIRWNLRRKRHVYGLSQTMLSE